MIKRKTKLFAKTNKNMSQDLLDQLRANKTHLFSNYEKVRTIESEPSSCLMCKVPIEGDYDEHFAVCEKVCVMSSCGTCGYEDVLGQVMIHELGCVSRRLATKEEILSMQDQPESPNLPTLTPARYTKSIPEEFEGSLLQALTTQQVSLPISQHSPLAPCFSAFLKRKPQYSMNLSMQAVLIHFLSNKLEGLTQTCFEFKEAAAVVEYQQCHSARGLIAGEKPCWFESDGRILTNMKPGEHQFVRANFAPILQRYWRNPEYAFTPLHTLFVQNIPIEDFMRDHVLKSSEFELLLQELCPMLDRNHLTVKSVIAHLCQYEGDVSKKALEMMESVVVRTQNVFMLKNFKKQTPLEKLRLFSKEVMKPLFKTTPRFEKNQSNYNVFVVDVIPDIASTMKSLERQNFPLQGKELVAHLAHNQAFGVFVGFFDLTKKCFVSGDFFRLRSISRYEKESTLFDVLMKDEELQDKTHAKYSQPLFFAKDFYTEEQNASIRFNPKDVSLTIPSDVIANRKRETATEDFASEWEINPYTLKFMDSKRTVGARLRKKHEETFEDFRWQSAFAEFKPELFSADKESRFECEVPDSTRRSLAPALKDLGMHAMHWEEIQKGIAYKA